MANINKKIAIIALIGGLLIGSGVVYLLNNLLNNRNVEDVVLEQIISTEEAGEKVLNAIIQHLLPPEITVSLVEVVPERGLYKIIVDIQGQEETLYLTKDGVLLFPQAIDLNALLATPAPTSVEKGPQKEFTQEELTRLAKRLTEIGAKFFGTYNCPFCVQQKEMFGQAAEFLPYIECSPNRATKEELILCKEANISSVPDWRFPNKEPILGMLPLERLIELSGCQLLKDRI